MWYVGETGSGLKIPAHTFGSDSAKTEVLIIGGVHGDEPEGIYASHGILEKFNEGLQLNLKVHIIPIFNIEGAMEHQRTNVNGVDLNRNLPTKDWTPVVAKPRYNPGPSAMSESENKALVSFLQQRKISYIISLHSWEPMLNINGDCRGLAEAIQKHTQYVITDDIGYPTPGSLGTYAGQEKKIPTLTYEIQRGLPCKDVLKVHVPAVIEGLRWIEKGNS